MPFALQSSDAEEGLGDLSALLPDNLLDSPAACQVHCIPDAASCMSTSLPSRILQSSAPAACSC
jgi:hypothetical protein